GEVRTGVAEGAELVDRDDAGVLELAADLGLLDEPADQRGLVPMRLEEHLDRQLAAQVAVAASEDGPHPAPPDLAEELVAGGTGEVRAPPWRRGRNGHGVEIVEGGIGKPDPRKRSGQGGQALEARAVTRLRRAILRAGRRDVRRDTGVLHGVRE